MYAVGLCVFGFVLWVFSVLVWVCVACWIGCVLAGLVVVLALLVLGCILWVQFSCLCVFDRHMHIILVCCLLEDFFGCSCVLVVRYYDGGVLGYCFGVVIGLSRGFYICCGCGRLLVVVFLEVVGVPVVTSRFLM